ncbi:serine/threonine-protein kinase [Spirosoma sp. SC4-14]|uniref:serine/threonine-protein kinase n=1 Tax=Spirosoma sp. SC4-14 TaxID=3128900 RepID=UPI0030D209EF
MSQTFTTFRDFRQRYPIRPNDPGALLGTGSYGRVFKVEDQLETEWVAIKISEFKGNDSKSLKAEVELARRMPRQANIARYDACYRIETDTSISDFAIMKFYADGNLADLLRREILTADQVYDITRGILLGLQHLHRHRVVHRDFKPANILISRDNAGRFIPKIADFGLSKLVSDDELDSSDFDLSDGRGTPSYKAPEQIEGSRVSFNLDLWAFGVILYEMLTGEKPFRSDLRNSSEQSVRRAIEKKIITVELPERLTTIQEPYQSIIRRCLVRDIHERARKETELLDLLDGISQSLAEAIDLQNQQRYEEALTRFEQILAKREHHLEAQTGAEACKLAINRQMLHGLLAKANDLLTRQQYEEAKTGFEQLLQLAPEMPEAARGLAFCIEQLRPKPVLVHEQEQPTDVYQAEKTDLYLASGSTVKPLIVSEQTLPTDIFPVTTFNEPPALLNTSVESKPIASQLPPAFPWRVVALGAIGLAIATAAGFYFIPDQSDNGPARVVESSTIGTTLNTKENAAPESGKLPAQPNDNNAKSTLNEQINLALRNARRAYAQKEYKQALSLITNAFRLDPTRQDVIAFRTTIQESIAHPPAEPTKENSLTTSSVPASASPEPEKSASREPAPTNNTESIRQQAQLEYDQLIDEGIKTIAQSNNKAKAIGSFSKARELAKTNNLNTTQADEAYKVYMTKANRIFDNDEYEGAREWFKVAQALKDTREVQIKIKQCTNQ